HHTSRVAREQHRDTDTQLAGQGHTLCCRRMDLELVKGRNYANNASRAPGRESMRRNGERHYINHYPHFSVHYYPQKEPEEVWYREWDNEIIAYGRKLLTVYESLKANMPQILAESDTPYDPASEQPYILMIEYRIRL